MSSFVLIGAVALWGAGAVAADLPVPSGQPITIAEVIWEDDEILDGRRLVLRFLAPEIARDGGTINFAAADADLEYLCNTYGLPFASTTGDDVAEIVVNLMDRRVERGVADADATQFFSAYSIEDGACIWE